MRDNNTVISFHKYWGYRNDGGDISRDKSGKLVVDHIENGEWLQFTVQSGKEDVYDLKIEIAAEDSNGKVRVIVNGRDTEITLPDTGNQFKLIAVKGVTMKKGTNILRLFAMTGGFRLSSISI
jgi:endoglucanase